MRMIHRSRNTAAGFSLIEVMVVVVILSILAALVVPKIMSRPDEARKVKARQDVMAIQSALDLYKLDNGFYPSTEQGLEALLTKPNSEPMPLDWKSYLKNLPKDPWGRPYLYLNPGQHGETDVYSEGPRHGNSTENSNDDIIGNWDAT